MSQFSESGDKLTLANYINIPDYYPAGRLDSDSEGLMILTNNGALQNALSHPDHKLPKTYWVRGEGDISEDALLKLAQGVELKDGMTKPATAKRMSNPALWERNPPIRERKEIPTSWISLTITEGRNRQVRRMTAAVGFPTLRLVRYAIGEWTIGDVEHGQYKQIDINYALPSKPSRRSTKNVQKPARKNGVKDGAHTPSGRHSKRNSTHHGKFKQRSN